MVGGDPVLRKASWTTICEKPEDRWAVRKRLAKVGMVIQ